MAKRRREKMVKAQVRVRCPKCSRRLVNSRRAMRPGDIPAYGKATGEWVKKCVEHGEVLTDDGVVVEPVRFVDEMTDEELKAIASVDMIPYTLRQVGKHKEDESDGHSDDCGCSGECSEGECACAEKAEQTE